MNRNFTVYSYIVKGSAIVDLIIGILHLTYLGTYHCHQSETLLAIVQKEFLDYCSEMRDYADGIEETMSYIMNQASTPIRSQKRSQQWPSTGNAPTKSYRCACSPHIRAPTRKANSIWPSSKPLPRK